MTKEGIFLIFIFVSFAQFIFVKAFILTSNGIKIEKHLLPILTDYRNKCYQQILRIVYIEKVTSSR